MIFIKKNVKKIFVVAFLIYIFMYIYINNSSLALTELLDYSNYFRNIFLVFAIFCSVVINKYTLKQYLIIITIFFLFFLNYYLSKRTELIFIFFVCLASRDLNKKSLIEKVFFVSCLSYLLVIISYFFGIIDDRIFIFNNGEISNTFGFYSPNTMAMIAFVLTMELFYVIQERIQSIATILLLSIPLVIVSYISNSKSALLALTIFLFLYIISFSFNKRRNLINKFLIIIIPIFPIISIVFSYLFGQMNTLVVKLNIALTGRISLGWMGLTKYGITLLGQKVEYLTNSFTGGINSFSGYFVLDNSYLVLLINFGLLITVILIIFCMLLYKSFLRRGQVLTAIILLGILIFSFSEQSFLQVPFNFFLIFFSDLFFETAEEAEEKEFIY